MEGRFRGIVGRFPGREGPFRGIVGRFRGTEGSYRGTVEQFRGREGPYRGRVGPPGGTVELFRGTGQPFRGTVQLFRGMSLPPGFSVQPNTFPEAPLADPRQLKTSSIELLGPERQPRRVSARLQQVPAQRAGRAGPKAEAAGRCPGRGAQYTTAACKGARCLFAGLSTGFSRFQAAWRLACLSRASTFGFSPGLGPAGLLGRVLLEALGLIQRQLPLNLLRVHQQS
jgi:hypothetical protein